MLIRNYAGLIVGTMFAAFAQADPLKIDTVLDDHAQLSPYEEARRNGRFDHGPRVGKAAAETCAREVYQSRKSVIAYQFDRSTRLGLTAHRGKVMLAFSMKLDSDVRPYRDYKVYCGQDGTGVQGALIHIYKKFSDESQRPSALPTLDH